MLAGPSSVGVMGLGISSSTIGPAAGGTPAKCGGDFSYLRPDERVYEGERGVGLLERFRESWWCLLRRGLGLLDDRLRRGGDRERRGEDERRRRRGGDGERPRRTVPRWFSLCQRVSYSPTFEAFAATNI
ncbi:hypothetical protein BJ742DRAFT_734747 [Cladochytrium replicatum]|nr:hypothetical protein BJ742DRAFT_734747 [Cladochytrium replicatum]